MRTAAAVIVAGLTLTTVAVRADVRSDQKTRVEFGGMLGRMVNIFGGKGAREGTTSTVAVKGDRKATLNDSTGQIVDLGEEKVYDLDLKKKTVRVTTFAELRRRMEEQEKKAEEEAKKEQPQAEQKPQQPTDEKQMEFDVDVKNTGQKKTINGFDTHEVVATITVREKGRTLEQGGGLVLIADEWLAPKIPAMKEVADFDRRYYEKLYGPMIAGASAEQMASAMALYPMLKPAIGRMNAQDARMDGTPISTTVTVDAVKSEQQMAEEAKQKSDDDKKSAEGGVGGLAGRLARRMAEKKMSGGNDAKARATVMTMTDEVLKVTTDVSAADVAVPAGFKEVK